MEQEKVNRNIYLNKYLNEEQKINDFLRNSLSWKITKPIRLLKPFINTINNLFLNKVSINQQSHIFMQWEKKFPNFNKSDFQIFENLKKKSQCKICIVILFNKDNISFFYSIINSIKLQFFEKIEVFPIFDDIENCEKYKRYIINSELVMKNNSFVKENEFFLILNGNTILDKYATCLYALLSEKEQKLFYSDSQLVINPAGDRLPFFKPDFSPALLDHLNYLEDHIFITGEIEFRKNIFNDIIKYKNFNKIFEKYIKHINKKHISHVPYIVSNILDTRFLQKQYKEKYSKMNEKVSIIIPTKNNFKYIKNCIQNLIKKTKYPKELIEIIVVDNGSTDKKTLEYFNKIEKLEFIKVLKLDIEFNFSKINNFAFNQSSGDNIIFLNDDTKLIDENWIQKINYYLLQSDVGIVGCKLLYKNNRVQHNGCVIGNSGIAKHAGVNLLDRDGGYLGLMNFSREVSAVTGACMAVRREVFKKLDEFDINLPVAFNDILLCLKSRKLGFRNIVIGSPLFYHFESVSRGLDLTSTKRNIYRRELEYTKDIIGEDIYEDPYYNANLDLSNLYQLSYPPRRRKYWRYSKYNPSPKKIIFISKSEDEKIKNLFEGYQKYYFYTDDYLSNAEEIIEYIFSEDVDLIISNVFSIWKIYDRIGNFCKTVNFDTLDNKIRFYDIFSKIYTYDDLKNYLENHVAKN